MRLLEHARGMFRWVQVWLDILLPALDDRNTIRRPENARTLLEQFEHDVTHTHNAYQLLRSGYQRLWDFNDLPEYREQRVRLFQIVLGAFEPQRVENLRDALRIQGSTYDQALTTKIVELASVGLWVSGSHDLGEIASEIAGNLKRDPLRGNEG